MLNTYKEIGYKYGIITYPEESKKELKELLDKTKPRVNLPRQKQLEVSIPVDPDHIIDFDHISGLTCGEVNDYKELLLDDKYLIFVMYDSIELRKENKEKAIIRYIGSLDTTRYKNMKIDSLIGNILIGNEILSENPYLNKGNQKRALCFLEKYLYGDKEHTYNAAYYKIKER